MITTATTVSVLLVASRYLNALRPLWSYVPAQWRWLPPAAFATVGALAATLPGAVGPGAIGEAVITSAVPLILAAMAGLHAPEKS